MMRRADRLQARLDVAGQVTAEFILRGQLDVARTSALEYAKLRDELQTAAERAIYWPLAGKTPPGGERDEDGRARAAVASVLA